jgi:thiol-disulfide isomerase/thioredoxin/Flp pilus assembly protein TadD
MIGRITVAPSFPRAWIWFLVFSCSPLLGPCLLFALQNPGFDSEVEAGRQAVRQGQYADAISHFTRANQLEQEKCSECYVWLARIDMSRGKLDQALKQAEQAVAVADTDQQRASAQLYRGVFLSQQGNLAAAEAAFTAALAADRDCVECAFNLGFVLLKESKDQEGVKVLKAIAPRFAGTPRGREIQRFIEDPSRVRKYFAPEFSARANSGQEINLDTLKGKVVLLDFWGTWCAPCRISLPLLKDLAAKVDPAKVAIISIDEYDPKPKWEQFIQANGMTWPQVYDGDYSLHNAFGVDGFPRYYILSKDGIILAEFKGWKENGEATISDAIASALQQ